MTTPTKKQSTNGALESFLLAEKPEKFIPTHVAILSIMIVSPGQRADFFLGKCGLKDSAAIKRALANLVFADMVTANDNGQYTAVLDKLPKGE
jgi:hypothetical protein